MVTYEWVIETLDRHEDIIDVNHADTYGKAKQAADKTVAPEGRAG
jgi:hypothetical protein